MIKGVLLDLDNTLLHNPDRPFARAFRHLFDEHFYRRFGVVAAAEALRPGIVAVSEYSDGSRANHDVMLRCLADGIGLSVESASDGLVSFYAEPYLELRPLTAPMRNADSLVEALLASKLHVAVATNPLYPEAATRQRLKWAGLQSYENAFAFVTHSENMHFAKPDAAYYAEVAARVGIEPDECLVIGDSVSNDIKPAKSLGMHAWRVTPDTGLEPLVERLQRPNWQDNLITQELHSEMLEPQFRGNLAALRGLLAEVKPHQWLLRPDPQEWSILQILCHLWRAESEVHQQRLWRIHSEDNPFIPALPPPGPDIPACHDDGFEVFERFRAERRATMAMLAEIRDEDWRRPARHSIFGLTNLLEMAHFTAQHDRLHITQLCQTLGQCPD